MTTGPHDPGGARALLTRTTDAVNELRELRSHDAAARNAMRTIRLAEHTIDVFWLPTLQRLVDDEHR